jgi:hypothetical protein
MQIALSTIKIFLAISAISGTYNFWVVRQYRIDPVTLL